MTWNLRDDEEWLTATELASRFGVTIWTVYKWRKRNGLTAIRICGRDYSSVVEAAAIDLAARDATRGRKRQLDVATAAA